MVSYRWNTRWCQPDTVRCHFLEVVRARSCPCCVLSLLLLLCVMSMQCKVQFSRGRDGWILLLLCVVAVVVVVCCVSLALLGAIF